MRMRMRMRPLTLRRSSVSMCTCACVHAPSDLEAVLGQHVGVRHHSGTCAYRLDRPEVLAQAPRPLDGIHHLAALPCHAPHVKVRVEIKGQIQVSVEIKGQIQIRVEIKGQIQVSVEIKGQIQVSVESTPGSTSSQVRLQI